MIPVASRELCSNFEMQRSIPRNRASYGIQCFLSALLLAATCHVAGAQQPSASDSIAHAAPASTPSAFANVDKLMQEGKIDDAIADLHTIETRDPNTKGLAFELGSAYYKKSDLMHAIEYLKKATAEDHDNREAIQFLGLSYYAAGHPNDAIPLLEQLQGLFNSPNVDAAYILGTCYIQTQNYPKARNAFAKMFGVPEDSAAAYLFTARMLFRQEFDPVAEEYAEKAAALDPKLPLVHELLGELYTYKSRIPEAIAEFEKELAIDPANAPTYYKLADAYLRIQKYDDAQRLLQRSIRLDATSTTPFILMGKVLEKKGEFDLALKALQRAATMDPNNPMTHFLLGQGYRNMGRKEEADSEFKLAEQLRNKENAQ